MSSWNILPSQLRAACQSNINSKSGAVIPENKSKPPTKCAYQLDISYNPQKESVKLLFVANNLKRGVAIDGNDNIEESLKNCQDMLNSDSLPNNLQHSTEKKDSNKKPLSKDSNEASPHGVQTNVINDDLNKKPHHHHHHHHRSNKYRDTADSGVLKTKSSLNRSRSKNNDEEDDAIEGNKSKKKHRHSNSINSNILDTIIEGVDQHDEQTKINKAPDRSKKSKELVVKTQSSRHKHRKKRKHHPSLDSRYQRLSTSSSNIVEKSSNSASQRVESKEARVSFSSRNKIKSSTDNNDLKQSSKHSNEEAEKQIRSRHFKWRKEKEATKNRSMSVDSSTYKDDSFEIAKAADDTVTKRNLNIRSVSADNAESGLKNSHGTSRHKKDNKSGTGTKLKEGDEEKKDQEVKISKHKRKGAKESVIINEQVVCDVEQVLKVVDLSDGFINKHLRKKNRRERLTNIKTSEENTEENTIEGREFITDELNRETKEKLKEKRKKSKEEEKSKKHAKKTPVGEEMKEDSNLLNEVQEKSRKEEKSKKARMRSIKADLLHALDRIAKEPPSLTVTDKKSKRKKKSYHSTHSTTDLTSSKPGSSHLKKFTSESTQTESKTEKTLSKTDCIKIIKITKQELQMIVDQLHKRHTINQATQAKDCWIMENKIATNTRKEISFSELNVKPLLTYYQTSTKLPLIHNEPKTTTNKRSYSHNTLVSVMLTDKKQQQQKTKKKNKTTDDNSVVSEAVTRREKAQYVNGKRFSPNRAIRNFAYSETLFESAKKALRKNGSATLSFIVEGVQPPKILKPHSDTTKTIPTTPRKLHTTILSSIDIKSITLEAETNKSISLCSQNNFQISTNNAIQLPSRSPSNRTLKSFKTSTTSTRDKSSVTSLDSARYAKSENKLFLHKKSLLSASNTKQRSKSLANSPISNDDGKEIFAGVTVLSKLEVQKPEGVRSRMMKYAEKIQQRQKKLIQAKQAQGLDKGADSTRAGSCSTNMLFGGGRDQWIKDSCISTISATSRLPNQVDINHKTRDESHEIKNLAIEKAVVEESVILPKISEETSSENSMHMQTKQEAACDSKPNSTKRTQNNNNTKTKAEGEEKDVPKILSRENISGTFTDVFNFSGSSGEHKSIQSPKSSTNIKKKKILRCSVFKTKSVLERELTKKLPKNNMCCIASCYEIPTHTSKLDQSKIPNVSILKQEKINLPKKRKIKKRTDFSQILHSVKSNVSDSSHPNKFSRLDRDTSPDIMKDKETNLASTVLLQTNENEEKNNESTKQWLLHKEELQQLADLIKGDVVKELRASNLWKYKTDLEKISNLEERIIKNIGSALKQQVFSVMQCSTTVLDNPKGVTTQHFPKRMPFDKFLEPLDNFNIIKGFNQNGLKNNSNTQDNRKILLMQKLINIIEDEHDASLFESRLDGIQRIEKNESAETKSKDETIGAKDVTQSCKMNPVEENGNKKVLPSKIKPKNNPTGIIGNKQDGDKNVSSILEQTTDCLNSETKSKWLSKIPVTQSLGKTTKSSVVSSCSSGRSFLTKNLEEANKLSTSKNSNEHVLGTNSNVRKTSRIPIKIKSSSYLYTRNKRQYLSIYEDRKHREESVLGGNKRPSANDINDLPMIHEEEIRLIRTESDLKKGSRHVTRPPQRLLTRSRSTSPKRHSRIEISEPYSHTRLDEMGRASNTCCNRGGCLCCYCTKQELVPPLNPRGTRRGNLAPKSQNEQKVYQKYTILTNHPKATKIHHDELKMGSSISLCSKETSQSSISISSIIPTPYNTFITNSNCSLITTSSEDFYNQPNPVSKSRPTTQQTQQTPEFHHINVKTSPIYGCGSFICAVNSETSICSLLNASSYVFHPFIRGRDDKVSVMFESKSVTCSENGLQEPCQNLHSRPTDERINLRGGSHNLSKESIRETYRKREKAVKRIRKYGSNFLGHDDEEEEELLNPVLWWGNYDLKMNQGSWGKERKTSHHHRNKLDELEAKSRKQCCATNTAPFGYSQIMDPTRYYNKKPTKKFNEDIASHFKPQRFDDSSCKKTSDAEYRKLSCLESSKSESNLKSRLISGKTANKNNCIRNKPTNAHKTKVDFSTSTSNESVETIDNRNIKYLRFLNRKNFKENATRESSSRESRGEKSLLGKTYRHNYNFYKITSPLLQKGRNVVGSSSLIANQISSMAKKSNLIEEKQNSFTVYKINENIKVSKKKSKRNNSEECFKIFAYNNVVDLGYSPVYKTFMKHLSCTNIGKAKMLFPYTFPSAELDCTNAKEEMKRSKPTTSASELTEVTTESGYGSHKSVNKGTSLRSFIPQEESTLNNFTTYKCFDQEIDDNKPADFFNHSAINAFPINFSNDYGKVPVISYTPTDSEEQFNVQYNDSRADTSLTPQTQYFTYNNTTIPVTHWFTKSGNNSNTNKKFWNKKRPSTKCPAKNHTHCKRYPKTNSSSPSPNPSTSSITDDKPKRSDSRWKGFRGTSQVSQTPEHKPSAFSDNKPALKRIFSRHSHKTLGKGKESTVTKTDKAKGTNTTKPHHHKQFTDFKEIPLSSLCGKKHKKTSTYTKGHFGGEDSSFKPTNNDWEEKPSTSKLRKFLINYKHRKERNKTFNEQSKRLFCKPKDCTKSSCLKVNKPTETDTRNYTGKATREKQVDFNTAFEPRKLEVPPVFSKESLICFKELLDSIFVKLLKSSSGNESSHKKSQLFKYSSETLCNHLEAGSNVQLTKSMRSVEAQTSKNNSGLCTSTSMELSAEKTRMLETSLDKSRRFAEAQTAKSHTTSYLEILPQSNAKHELAEGEGAQSSKQSTTTSANTSNRKTDPSLTLNSNVLIKMRESVPECTNKAAPVQNAVETPTKKIMAEAMLSRNSQEQLLTDANSIKNTENNNEALRSSIIRSVPELNSLKKSLSQHSLELLQTFQKLLSPSSIVSKRAVTELYINSNGEKTSVNLDSHSSLDAEASSSNESNKNIFKKSKEPFQIFLNPSEQVNECFGCGKFPEGLEQPSSEVDVAPVRFSSSVSEDIPGSNTTLSKDLCKMFGTFLQSSKTKQQAPFEDILSNKEDGTVLDSSSVQLLLEMLQEIDSQIESKQINIIEEDENVTKRDLLSNTPLESFEMLPDDLKVTSLSSSTESVFIKDLPILCNNNKSANFRILECLNTLDGLQLNPSYVTQLKASNSSLSKNGDELSQELLNKFEMIMSSSFTMSERDKKVLIENIRFLDDDANESLGSYSKTFPDNFKFMNMSAHELFHLLIQPQSDSSLIDTPKLKSAGCENEKSTNHSFKDVCAKQSLSEPFKYMNMPLKDVLMMLTEPQSNLDLMPARHPLEEPLDKNPSLVGLIITEPPKDNNTALHPTEMLPNRTGKNSSNETTSTESSTGFEIQVVLESSSANLIRASGSPSELVVKTCRNVGTSRKSTLFGKITPDQMSEDKITLKEPSFFSKIFSKVVHQKTDKKPGYSPTLIEEELVTPETLTVHFMQAEEKPPPKEKEDIKMREEFLKSLSGAQIKTMIKLHSKVTAAKKTQVTFKMLADELCKSKDYATTESELDMVKVLKRFKHNYIREQMNCFSCDERKTEQIDGINEEAQAVKAPKQESQKNEQGKVKKPDTSNTNEIKKPISRGEDAFKVGNNVRNKESDFDDSVNILPTRKNTKGSSAQSLTDKEQFEKLLDSYEKEDEMVEKISQDQTFFQSQLDLVQSSAESLLKKGKRKQGSSSESDEKLLKKLDMESLTDIGNTRKPNSKSAISAVSNVSNASNGTILRQASKPKSDGFKTKVQQMFGKSNGGTEMLAPRFDRLKKYSVDQSYLSNKNEQSEDQEKIAEAEEYRKSLSTNSVVDDGQKVKFGENERPVAKEKQKTGSRGTQLRPDSNEVQPKDLGKCFLRGFRSDYVSLDGETCLYIGKNGNTGNSTDESFINFSERNTPLDFLLALGFSIDEASNAIKDEDVQNRLLAAITEARVWVNQISTVQGTLLYLLSYKSKRNMRYFLQVVEAIINKRIRDAVKLHGFLKVLEKVEDGDLTMASVLGADKFDDEENEEKIVKKQLRQLFINVYKIAEYEAEINNNQLTKEAIILLRILSAKYRAGLHPHLELIAKYIGQDLLKTEVQLEAAMIYLSRLDTADVNLKEFERYCGISCNDSDSRKKNTVVETKKPHLTEDEIAKKYG